MKKKQIVISLITLIFSALFLVNWVFFSESKNLNTLELKATNKELGIIYDIYYDNKEIILENYFAESEILDDNTVVFSDVKSLEYTNLNNIKIVLSKNVELKNNNEVQIPFEETENYNAYLLNDISYFNIIINYISGNIFNSLILFIISFVIYYFLLNFILILINKIRNNQNKIKDNLLFILLSFCLLLNIVYPLINLCKYLLIVVYLAILLFCFYKKIKNIEVHNIFLIFATITSIFMLLLIPVFHVPDESSHFVKSYVESHVFSDNNVRIIDENPYYSYVKLPDSLNNLLEINNDYLNYSTKTNINDYYKTGSSHLNQDRLSDEEFWFGNTTGLSSFAYFPTILLFAFLRLVNVSPIFFIILGRFINLLIYLLLVYYAIKKIPKFKKTLFIVSTLPICLQQASAINQDFVTNGIFFLLLALIIKEIYDKGKINVKNLLLIALLGIMLCFCKMGYFFVIFLLFLIPKKRFKNGKQKAIWCSLICAIMLIIFLAQYLNVSFDSPSKECYKLSYMIKNPLELIKIYFNTFYTWVDYMFFRGLFNGFGWSTKYYSTMLNSFTMIIYAILFFSGDEDAANLSIFKRIFLLVLSLLITCCICAAMLFGWTQVGMETIDGIQPRYFIPSLLLLLISLHNNFIIIKKDYRKMIYPILLTIIYVCTFYLLLKGFY